MIESLEQALLAAWSGLAFIPVIGHAVDAALEARGRRRPSPDPEALVPSAVFAARQIEVLS